MYMLYFFRIGLKIIFLVVGISLLLITLFPESHKNKALDNLNFVHSAIKDIHPGVVINRDPQFERWYKEGYLQSLKMAEQATSQHLEIAPAIFYIKGFKDVHVNLMQRTTLWNLKKQLMDRPLWAGWVTQMMGDSVVVTSVPSSPNSKRSHANLPDPGSEVISCDGIPVREYIKKHILPFVDARADVHAAWAKSAPYISMADGMTRLFLAKPGKCLVKSLAGVTRTINLQWEPFEGERSEFRRTFFPDVHWPEDLKDYYGWKLLSTGILWVKVGTLKSSRELNGKLDIFLNQLRLLKAEKIVIDLRGNGGGNSLNGTKILQSLFDKDYYQSNLAHYLKRSSYGESIRYWRVSERALTLTRSKFDSVHSNEKPFVNNLYFNLLTAKEQGHELYAEHTGPMIKDIEDFYEYGLYGLNKGKLYVITDFRCASSCITLLSEAKEIFGAVHLGEETNPGTQFSEVVEIPFGEYSLTLPTRYDPQRESNVARKPDIPFNGDINNTQSLMNWFQQVIELRM